MSITFFTPFSSPRPIRLSETTRRFALESLEGKYGKEALANPCVVIDAPKGRYTNDYDRYDDAVLAIAKGAPLRFCENELLCGSATLGNAIDHQVPVRFTDTENLLWSVSHLTIDYSEVLTVGMKGIRARAEKCTENCDPEKERFYKSVFACLDAFEIYHSRYLAALGEMTDPEKKKQFDILSRVPMNGAKTFREALQSIWFVFSFVRLTGNWPGFGRLDVILGDYLRKDLADGIITPDEARELMAHFFIKGCEWVNGAVCGSGDAQHYQNIVLSGIDKDGNDITNEISYLILDTVEELPIGDFPIAVRLNKKSDPAFVRRVAEVIRFGGGVVAVYNEDIILESLMKYGYRWEDAVRFANDGCWEVQIPGETAFGYSPFDCLSILQHYALKSYTRTDFTDWESVYSAFTDELRNFIFKNLFYEGQTMTQFEDGRPCTVVSIFEKDCIGRGLSYMKGGPNYTVSSPHIGGIADVVNTLYAIKKLVFDDKRVTLAELFEILRNNWEGHEALRQYAMNKYKYFGNANPEVDGIYRRVVHDFSEICLGYDKNPIRLPIGISTFGRQIEWAHRHLATPYGKKAYEILAGNTSPTPGTDCSGATSVIKSYCYADLRETVTGAALDLPLTAADLKGEEGLNGLISLINGFLELGGYFLQPDVASAELLREAQRHPENYQTLSVRVSGWNARFATLDRDWQNMVIERMSGRE